MSAPLQKRKKDQRDLVVLDPPEVIGVCLSCERETCPNGTCKTVRTVVRQLDTGKHKSRSKDGSLMQRRMELYEAGLNDEQIAEAAGCTKCAVRSWRKRLDLPENKEK